MSYINDPREPPEEIVEQTPARIRAVRIINAVVHAVCWVFALVLIVHILLVFGEANPGNGFAQLIDQWSRAVSLGLRNLFTPEGIKPRTLFNDGLAALLWLIIGGVVTDLVSRIGLPGPKRVWYRRPLS
ncbi:hypothetical protein AB0E55_04220 [Amycolatopsis keratiniphila]|uniref:Uncharacterized protein n=1 Tax=Amycolatopsis keratiniphila TaxID=129921 RepID=R4T1H6_9PSEU|nr:hypothetical protein [Amycolatopsis keratiniphila]AGM04533.1 hypothetical protein AORI_1945 [Amycolatopsis keratiniphila]